MRLVLIRTACSKSFWRRSLRKCLILLSTCLRSVGSGKTSFLGCHTHAADIDLNVLFCLYSIDDKWKWKTLSFAYIVHPRKPFAALWICGEDAWESYIWGIWGVWSTQCFRPSSLYVTLICVHAGHRCGRPFCLLLPESSLRSPPQHFLQLYWWAALVGLRVLQEPHVDQG